MSNVRPAPGPDGRRGTSYEFLGRRNSFIHYPNNGRLDTRNSITILAWIYHQGRAGPIFNYHPKAWGVHLWMVGPRTLFVRFTKRGNRDFTPALVSKTVKRSRWQYVGATYDQSTGIAKLFVSGRRVAKRHIGRIRLATNYPARMGVRVGDGRYFRGRISCLQVYNVALSARQIAARAKRCFVPGLPKPRPPPLPTGRLYKPRGCFRDKARRAMGRVLGVFRGRRDAVMRCFLLASRRGYRVFGVQNGGECFSGPTAHRTFGRYGRSNRCRNGKGGPWANDVYIIITRRPIPRPLPRPRPRPRPALPICKTHVDLGFIVDGSGSVGRANFIRCLNFIKNLVSSFEISSRSARVGILLYSHRLIPLFSFGQYKSLHGVLRAINKIKYPSGGTKTGQALSYSRRYLFARSNRRKVLILMTDGKSYDVVKQPAAALRNMGVEVFAVGVGKRFSMRQLIQIASNRRHIFTADFRNLGSFVRAIKQKACKGIIKRPTKPKDVPAIAIFPFSKTYQGSEIRNRNPPGRPSRVFYGPGPDGLPYGSYYFRGRPHSYVEIPNSGRLDVRNCLTILAWIYHDGNAGPIVNYKRNGWGVHFWMVNPRTLFVRYTQRLGRRFTYALTYRRVKPRTWQFVGTSYNRNTGVAKLYINGRRVARRKIGKISLATNYEIRVGARQGDRRYFRGRIACLQFYNAALTTNMIRRRMKTCFRKGPMPVPVPRPRPGGRVCKAKLDLGFVIDGSGSVGISNFKRCLQFIKNLVHTFIISRRYTRVGAVLYNTRAYKIFGFNRYGNKNQVLRAMSRIQYPKGGTKTGRALRYAYRYLFRRSRRRKVCVVMTDGRSYDSVSGPARNLRKGGVEVISLGLGLRYNIRQLRQMASNRRLVFTARFRNLNSVVRVIKKKACGTTGVRPKPPPRAKPPRPGQATYYWEGCYNDRSRRAIKSLVGVFRRRKNPVRACAMAALRRGYKVFAVENGGECYSGRLASRTYNRYGPTDRCRHGTGGSWAMDVYKFGKPRGWSNVIIRSLGCFKDKPRRAAGSMVANLRGLKFAVRDCARQARKRGYRIFALQNGGECFMGPRAKITYNKYGPSKRCRGGKGGLWANNVYILIIKGRPRPRPRPRPLPRPRPRPRQRPRPAPRPRPFPRPSLRACRARLDLAFLIDGSGSVESSGRGNFRRCLNFVKRIVASFTVSPSYTRVGVVLFSSRTWLVFNFNRYRNKRQIFRAIDAIRYPRGGTRIGSALRFVNYRLFRGNRRGKALIVLTDGLSQDRVSRPSFVLRRSGVNTFVVAIGRRTNRRQLLQIASSSRNIYRTSFRRLNYIVRSITRRVCKSRVTATARAVAIFPLTGRTSARDVSRRNPRGVLGYVRPVQGPDGTRDGAYQFYGRSNSYILFPNRGGLDTKYSISLLAWIYHQGQAGPIFNYMPNGWGVHFWMVSPRTLFVRFTRRGRRSSTHALISRTVTPWRWQFVGATYDGRSGVAKLFVNGRFTVTRYIGRIRLATNYPVRMGARIGDRRYFKGRISCMQVYNGALTRSQINSKKRKCFRRTPVRPRPLRPRPPPRPSGRVCRKRVDLAFLIDGSGSIESSGRGNFQRCIRFVKTVVSSFSIAPQRTRVGVVLFSSRSWLILDFYRSTNKARVLHTISRIRYPRGGTRIGKALNFVLYRLFRRSRRAMKALVVMTDGLSQDSVRRPALALRSQGVWVFALGIGRRYRRSQLLQIATNRRYVLTANFRHLNKVAQRISSKICRSRPLRPKPFRPGPPIRPSGSVCRRRLDLAFLIDGSGSIEASGRGNFRRCLNFVKRVVASFQISPRKTRVGVVLFSSRAWLVFNFRRLRNKHNVLYAISRIRYPRGGTKIGRALRFARYQLFNRKSSRRKVLITMTDGISQDSVVRASRDLRNRGVRILALGIGRRIRRSQLTQITGNSRYVFYADVRNLNGVVRSIKQTACKGSPPRPRPIRPRPPVRPSGRVCRRRLDLGFLIDGSGSIEAYGRGNFRRCLRFVKRVVASFQISPRQARVGVVLFSSRAWLVFNFRQLRNMQSIVRAIGRIRYPRGGTRIGRALRFAKYQLFNRKSSRRKILIVMTDGISQDSVGKPARDLRNRGVRILALGIGKRFRRSQLNQMAKKRRYVFNAGFRNLNGVVRSIKRTACGARKRTLDQGLRRIRWRGHGRKIRRLKHDQRIRDRQRPHERTIHHGGRNRRRPSKRHGRTNRRNDRGRKKKRRRPFGKKRSEVINKPNNYDDHKEAPENDNISRFYLRSDIAKVKTEAPNSNLTASYLWNFKSSMNKSVVIDKVHGRKVRLEGGARVTNTTDRGLVADTNGGWLDLNETNGTCFSDPEHCADKGLTVMSWLKLNKSSLSETASSYIMSSGGQSTKARGFAVLYLAKKYIAILSTRNKQWKLDTPVLPSGWFNLAFTWREKGQLKLYVNGTHVVSGNPALVSRPQDSFTTFDIGRPNNSDKPFYRFPLMIDGLALWERELSGNEIKSAMNMPPNRLRRTKKQKQ